MAVAGINSPVAPPSAVRRKRFALLRKLSAIQGSTLGMIGVAILSFWVIMAVFAPWLAPYPPNKNDLPALAYPYPSLAHPLGVDQLGRDILSRIIWGARTVLGVAPVAVLAATMIGTLAGLTAGYFRGWIDTAISRVGDIILAFPNIILYMIILAKFGPSSWNIIWIVAITNAPIVARIIRGATLELRQREYVDAAKMRGESSLYVMLFEILPNARGPLIVDFCLRVGYTVITIGALGFLGIGLPPPHPDWGGMVKDTYSVMYVWPHMSVFPCLAISSLVVGFNFLAIGVREVSFRD